MAKTSGYHQYLFLGKLTDTLTEREKQELDQLFATDENAVNEFNILLKKFPEDQVNQGYTKLKQPGFWEDLGGQARREQNRKRAITWISVSVAILALTFTSIAIFYPYIQKKEIVVAKKPKSIELKLSNGHVIDLSATKGKIENESLNLDNNDNGLSYSNTNANSGINSITVPIGMDYKINLSDGSEVWMNSDTKLEFPSSFQKDKREIKINGEAYLKIAKNPTVPFYVRLNQGLIQVTGTEFNVNNYRTDNTAISLVEGGINFVSDNITTSLKPGKQLHYTSGQLNETSFEENKVLSWRKGLFYFDRSSLDEISDVLARWYGITTKIDNPVLREKKFAGVLNKNRPVSVFLDNLKAITDLTTFYDAEGVLHFK
jgi:transmembrane sensor